MAYQRSRAYSSSMLSDSTIAQHRAVQDAAREVLAELGPTICSTDTEASIARRAIEALARRGLTQTWYHNCPALVLLGSRSCLSISGRNYEAVFEAVGSENLVTVDLSPQRGDIWGDCARSFFIEDGRSTPDPTLAEFVEGKRFLESLHAAMLEFVDARTTFGQLFDWANERISAAGFENLDFAGNVGHSIEKRRSDRRYIEAGNHGTLGEAQFFTFEPHLRRIGRPWGFKHENIFFFDADGTAGQL